MDDGWLSEHLHKRRADAVQAVEKWMDEFGAVRKPDIAAAWPEMTDGWSLRIDVAGEPVGLEVLLPVDFPWRAPKVCLSQAPPFPSTPHVERDGSLCVLPSGSEWDTNDPIGLLEALIVDAARALTDGSAGLNQGDFRAEIQSYWTPVAGLPEIRSFLRPDPGSRPIRVWKGKSFYLLADDNHGLNEWLRHRFPGRTNFGRHRGALLCWLHEPPLPSEFPCSSTALLDLIERAGLAGELPKAIASDARGVLVILGFPVGSGTSFVAVELLPSAAGWQNRRFSVEQRLTRGFRRERIPGQVLADRFLARSQVRFRKAQRVDPEWIHGRDSNSDLPSLSASTVAMVGCGSLGSLVARQLAASGVGGFVLVDPENVEAANTGRHALGSPSIGLSKAAELARILEADFPHLVDTKVAINRWQAAARAEPRLFRSADIVVSTIGSWTSESMLDGYLAGLRSKVIYGWMEPHAAAAHTVFLDHDVGGRCFNCGMTRKGTPQFVVTRWSEQTLKQEPACGAMFQPYGAVNLTQAASLVAELALEALLLRIGGGMHRVRSVSQRALDHFGGAWSEDWLAATGDTAGGREIERTWPSTKHCPGCQ